MFQMYPEALEAEIASDGTSWRWPPCGPSHGTSIVVRRLSGWTASGTSSSRW